jgi:hypothetical protein
MYFWNRLCFTRNATSHDEPHQEMWRWHKARQSKQKLTNINILFTRTRNLPRRAWWSSHAYHISRPARNVHISCLHSKFRVQFSSPAAKTKVLVCCFFLNSCFVRGRPVIQNSFGELLYQWFSNGAPQEVARCAANIMKVDFKNEEKPICIEIYTYYSHDFYSYS